MVWFESELVAVFNRNGGLGCDGICTGAGVREMYPAFERDATKPLPQHPTKDILNLSG
jgi:hypothetical protein